MKKLLLMTLLLIILFASCEKKEPEVVVALTVRNIWRMGIGADYPDFTIYSDRTLVTKELKYDTNLKSRERYVFKKSKIDKKDFQDLMKLIRKLEFDNIKSYYNDLSFITDLPTNKFYINTGKAIKQTWVYGRLDYKNHSYLDSIYDSNNNIIFTSAREYIPENLLDLFDYVYSLESKNHESWQPNDLILLLDEIDTNYFDINEKIYCPKNWPSKLENPEIEYGNMDYQLVIPNNLIEEVLKFIDNYGHDYNIFLYNKYWSIYAVYRLPYKEELEYPEFVIQSHPVTNP